MSEQEENTGSVFYFADNKAVYANHVASVLAYVWDKSGGGHRHQFYITTVGGDSVALINSDMWYGEEADDPGPTLTLKQITDDISAVIKGSQQKYALCCCEPEEEEPEPEVEEEAKQL